VTLGANVESQNFVGASSSGGHSISSYSSGVASLPASRSCAERTLTRAKRDDKTSFVPSRQRTVLQLLFGSASASFSTLIGVLSLRPRRELADSVARLPCPAPQTVFVVLTPATYLRSRRRVAVILGRLRLLIAAIPAVVEHQGHQTATDNDGKGDPQPQGHPTVLTAVECCQASTMNLMATARKPSRTTAVMKAGRWRRTCTRLPEERYDGGPHWVRRSNVELRANFALP
jgi:hypothetical protein